MKERQSEVEFIRFPYEKIGNLFFILNFSFFFHIFILETSHLISVEEDEMKKL